jgi:putative peptidoglycan lipid II flippase
MIGALSRRGDYAPSAKATNRLIRIALVSAALGVVLHLCQANRDALEAFFGSKEASIAVLILGGGTSYFIVLFLVRAVTIGEVRGAFRREAGAANGGGGLPPAADG